jgi:hypothetical protein
MRDLVILFVHFIVTLARLAGPGAVRSVVAESVLVKHQLVIHNRSRQRSPNLRISDRLIAGLCALLMRPSRLIRSAIVLRPSTLLNLHHGLKTRKYRLLFSSKRRRKPGPKGPSQELVEAVIEMKKRNPSWGRPRIAQQIALAVGIEINKDMVGCYHSGAASNPLDPFFRRAKPHLLGLRTADTGNHRHDFL